MKHIFRLKQIILAGLAAALLFTPLLVVGQVGAQASNANAADGLQISPAVVEVNGEAGKSYTIDINVMNVTGSDLVFDTVVNDFSAQDESGSPSVNLDDSIPSAASIKRWVSVIASFDIKARQNKKITATLSIPSNAEPGGHYGVIRFAGRAPELEGTGVGLAASAGTLVLVRVAGAVDEKLDLITFQTAQNDNASGFFEYGPIDFVMRFENKGNVHVKPIGQIEVRDMFGNKVETLAVNGDKGNVLPLSIRRFESTLDRTWMFGRYTADISVAYGTTGQAIVQSISFWVIPYKVILGALLVLATLIFVFRTLIKRYNNYIIRRANHGKTQKKRKK